MSHADITTEIAQSLQREALTIATAESCTVGGVCARLGSIAGASTYLRGCRPRDGSWRTGVSTR